MRLIDSNELKEWVKNWFEKHRYYHPYSKANDIPITELYDLLEQMPTVDAEPVRHGRWVKTGQSFLFPERFRNFSCSLCGYDIDKTKHRYCPSCGAKMDGGVDDGNS